MSPRLQMRLTSPRVPDIPGSSSDTPPLATPPILGGPTALARPSPRGDLSGSLAARSLSLRALFPLPRATPLR